MQEHINKSMIANDKKALKNIARFKWSNPNKFNALTSAVAYLVALVGFLALGVAISPLILLLTENGVGFGVTLCLSAILSQAFIFAIAWIFAKIKHVSLFNSGDTYLKFDFLICIPALALSIGTFLFVYPIHMQFAEQLAELQKILFGASSIEQALPEMGLDDAVYLLFYAFILAPVLPAICEEALFRGVIMDGLKEYGNLFAILVSGFLFAIMHGNYAQIILQFFLGCEIAFVVIITKNYFAGMVMHFCNNFFAIIYSVGLEFSKMLSVELGLLFQCFALLIGIALICFAIVYYFKLNEHLKSGNSDKPFLFYKNKAKHAPCCLLRKGAPYDLCFAVQKEVVLQNDNSNFTFFNNGKFRKFSKKSNYIAFWIVLAIALTLGVGIIFLDFILVG